MTPIETRGFGMAFGCDCELLDCAWLEAHSLSIVVTADTIFFATLRVLLNIVRPYDFRKQDRNCLDAFKTPFAIDIYGSKNPTLEA